MPNRLASPDAGLLTDLQQSWGVPTKPRPIVIIGAGGIVRTAHLPVYHQLKFPVAGLFDVDPEASRDTARRFAVANVFSSLAEATASPETVFDVAVPGDQIAGVLRELPRGSAVLIQKPMGEDLDGAKTIRNICQDRGLIAAMNFQLRFSPNVLALRDLIGRGQLGEIVDIEVRLVVKQPWHLWAFLKGAPRLEILYHSIHYLDTIRAIVGEPRGVYCRAVAHPAMPEFRDTRSTVILDYGEHVRCSLLLNHVHQQDTTQCVSFLKVEGTHGAAQLTMGVNIDYPNGLPDTLDVALERGHWKPVALRGSWFIEGFEGPMSNLQRFVAGEDAALISPVDDAIKTMALVEACYQSSASGGTPIPPV
jgi:predicted dehydrogenase